MTASDVAFQRLVRYLDKLKSDNVFDTGKWEFYTFLLEQAKGHQIDYSGFASAAYKEDQEEARKINAARPEPPDEFHLPERKKRGMRI